MIAAVEYTVARMSLSVFILTGRVFAMRHGKSKASISYLAFLYQSSDATSTNLRGWWYSNSDSFHWRLNEHESRSVAPGQFDVHTRAYQPFALHS